MNVWRTTLVAALLMAIGTAAQAGVVVGGTRLIYDGGKKESSLSVSNPDKIPYLIQSWVDAGENNTAKAPFVITPPLFRLDGEQKNIMRVVRAGGDLPTDKESLYWLNVKSIPSTEKKANTLQIAVKTRIKLIYRPAGLPGSLNEAAEGLQWTFSGNSLHVTNSSPYYLTFFTLKVGGNAVKEPNMVAPQSSAQFSLPGSANGGAVSWQIINDYGGVSPVFTKNL